MTIINTTPYVVGRVIKELEEGEDPDHSDKVVKDIRIVGKRLIFSYGDSGRINIINVDGTPLPINQSDKSVSIDLSGKVDKVSGKGLSTNDYTTAEKNKLAMLTIGNTFQLTEVD